MLTLGQTQILAHVWVPLIPDEYPLYPIRSNQNVLDFTSPGT